MNWDEQLIAACIETDGKIHTHTDHVLTGAKWQRNQLRTNGAIERVAESIWTTDPEPALEPFDGPETWEALEPELKDDYRHAARHAITALLGDD